MTSLRCWMWGCGGEGFGLRLSDLKVSDLGFRASDLGFRVSDLGLRVSDLGYMV